MIIKNLQAPTEEEAERGRRLFRVLKTVRRGFSRREMPFGARKGDEMTVGEEMNDVMIFEEQLCGGREHVTEVVHYGYVDHPTVKLARREGMGATGVAHIIAALLAGRDLWHIEYLAEYGDLRVRITDSQGLSALAREHPISVIVPADEAANNTYIG